MIQSININMGGYIIKLYFKGYLVPQNKLKHLWNNLKKKKTNKQTNVLPSSAHNPW